MTVPILGHISGLRECIKVSPKSLNQHILTTGKSGSGKTNALKKIEDGIALQGGRVLVLNFNGTHDSLCGQSQVNFINARMDGIPLSLFSPVIRPDGRMEEADDICEAVVDVFSDIGKMGSKQRRILSNACNRAMKIRGSYDDDMGCLHTCLMECDDDAAQGIIDRFGGLLKRARFKTSGELWENGRITVLDFSEFNVSMQKMLAELVMAILWRNHRINGQQTDEPVWIVCDEFQSLNLREGSILTQILQEGRKFGLSLLLATQTLSIFDTGCRAILQQAGTKLYFRPADSDIRKLSKDIPGVDRNKIQRMLQELKVGECLAMGEFLIGMRSVERVFKVTFRSEG